MRRLVAVTMLKCLMFILEKVFEMVFGKMVATCWKNNIIIMEKMPDGRFAAHTAVCEPPARNWVGNVLALIIFLIFHVGVPICANWILLLAQGIVTI